MDESHLATKPVEMGNKEFLKTRLQELEEKYSEEELSGLSSRMLAKEEKALEKDFWKLRRRFPHSDYALQGTPLQEIQMGDNYRGLSTLTADQRQWIKDTEDRLRRNIGRKMRNAKKEEQSEKPWSRLASWLTEFADNLPSISVIRF